MGTGVACDLAWAFLRRDRRAWRRTVAVVAVAEQLRAVLPAGDGDRLVRAAWLLDIGRSPDLRVTGFVPLDGALHLDDCGLAAEAALVAHRSAARFAAARLGLGRELARWPYADSPVLDALTYADLRGDPPPSTAREPAALAAAARVHLGRRRRPREDWFAPAYVR
jgi:hypothetical protein